MEKYKKKEGLFALLPVIILVLTVFFAGSPVKAEEKKRTRSGFSLRMCVPPAMKRTISMTCSTAA